MIKKGLATMPVKFGISFNRPALNQAGALVHVYTDGSVLLNHGGTEMGQGLFVKVAQVVAEAFSIDLDRIRVSATRPRKVPNTSPTAASSGSDLNGMAALNAAEQIKARMTEVAAEHFAVPAGEIVFAANRVYAGNRSMSFARARAAVVGEARVAVGDRLLPHAEDPLGFRHQYAAGRSTISSMARPPPRSRSTRSPARSRVLRAELLQDCGRSLNPAIDLGQIEGAFVQGMGWLTTEELWWDADGPAAHPRALDLQDSRQPRRAAGVQCAHPRRRAQPRGDHLPLQGGGRAAADAGDLGVSRDPRRDREPRRLSRRPRRSTRRRRPSACWRRSTRCGVREEHPLGLTARRTNRPTAKRDDLGGGAQVVEPQVLVGVVRVGLEDRARSGAVEHDRDAARRVMAGIGVERHAGHRHIDAQDCLAWR